MNERNDQSAIVEVESRLEDLLGKMDEPIELIENSGVPEDSPFRNLKALVLSIDWEITDEIMADFIQEIDALRNRFKDDKVLVLFLQLLGSLGKYIKNNRAAAHPDSLQVLSSVYESMEGIVLSDGMSEPEKKKILAGEVDKYKRLREEISCARAVEGKEARAVRETAAPAKTASPAAVERTVREAVDKAPDVAVGKMPPHEAFAYALEEIRQTIQTEFQAIRAELRLWRQE